MITVGSLFSGIGGLELGLERAGMEVVWQVEREPYALRVLEKHWPDVERFTDVRDVGRHNFKAVDLICGGFPCQDVSLAGKRAGLEGERSTLWSEFARIIRELEPRWVLAENVPGLLSSDSGRFFGNVLRDLAASGYDAEWDCIPAAAVGAPHRRYRVFIVAHANGHGLAKAEQGRANSAESSGAVTLWAGAEGCGADVPHASQHGRGAGRAGGLDPSGARERKPEREVQDVADAQGAGEGHVFRQGRGLSLESGGESRQRNAWATEPDVGRVAHGVPARVDRLRCLGNSVVPQVAYWIGQRILTVENER